MHRVPAVCDITGLSTVSPLHPLAWRAALARHPDQTLVNQLVLGITDGVDIGYTSTDADATGDMALGLHQCNNLPTAYAQPASIDADIAATVASGHKAGPYTVPPYRHFRCSPLGTVPKTGSDKHRVIHHLSWPRTGRSVNARIPHFECKLASFDDAAAMVQSLGIGAWMCKLDIAAAYKCIPVAPRYWHLLGMRWQGMYYFDKQLPFGMASSCAIWEQYATAAEWIVHHELNIPHQRHYVDDFIVAAATQQHCQQRMDAIVRLFGILGLPLADSSGVNKVVAPTQQLVYLGIEIDSIKQCCRLSDARLAKLVSIIDTWLQKDTATQRELLSLAGTLHFACRVVRPGRAFVRRLLNLAHSLQRLHTRVSLSHGTRADLRWWHQFAHQWNGVSWLYEPHWQSAHCLHLHTDASLQGYGAVFGTHWFACEWTRDELALAHRLHRVSLPWMELYALVRAAATWGHLLRGKRLHFHCDSATSVAACQRMSSRSIQLMKLIRCLLFIAAQHGFEWRIKHIAGTDNIVADCLSRMQVERFRMLVPLADPSPTVPPPLPIQHW